MNNVFENYIAALEATLVSSEFVDDFIIQSQIYTDDDLKVKLCVFCINTWRIEVFIYAIRHRRQLQIHRYSFYCIDNENNLIFRWDNAPHHPNLKNFPHHIHLSDNSVIPALKTPGIADVLEYLADRME